MTRAMQEHMKEAMTGRIRTMSNGNVRATTIRPLLVPPNLIQRNVTAGGNKEKERLLSTRGTCDRQVTTVTREKSATGCRGMSPTFTTLYLSVILMKMELTSETTGSLALISSTKTAVATVTFLKGVFATGTGPRLKPICRRSNGASPSSEAGTFFGGSDGDRSNPLYRKDARLSKEDKERYQKLSVSPTVYGTHKGDFPWQAKG